MLDKEFCEFLEYRICKFLEHSDNLETKGFWCDGVSLPELEKHYFKKYVHDNRQVILKAYLGKDGQTEYELILKFGRKALNKYAKNADIQACMPSSDNVNWLNINITKRTIDIQLD